MLCIIILSNLYQIIVNLYSYSNNKNALHLRLKTEVNHENLVNKTKKGQTKKLLPVKVNYTVSNPVSDDDKDLGGNAGYLYRQLF